MIDLGLIKLDNFLSVLQSQVLMCFCKVKSGLIMTSSGKRVFDLDIIFECNAFEILIQYLFTKCVCDSYAQVFDCSSSSVDSSRDEKSSSLTYSSRQKLKRTTNKKLGMITAVNLMQLRDSIDTRTGSLSNM